MTDRDSNRVHYAAPCSGRVQRASCGGCQPLEKGEGGFTLVEVVMTMVILSVGLLSLAPLMLSVVRGNRFSQDMTLATALAEDRMEEIVNHLVYSDITAANFPSEARGEIQSGDPAYIKFERTVSIVDSTDILGESTMKNITITVSWRGWSQSDHTVTLYGRVVRF